MTPERAKELMPVLQAFADGGKVEYWDKMQEGWLYVEACRILDYINQGFLFRVKPKPEIIPFDYSDDLVGKTVVLKSETNPYRKMIIMQSDCRVWIADNPTPLKRSYADLMRNYTFPDCSPCGKERAE